MDKNLELLSKKDKERMAIVEYYKKEYLPLILEGKAKPTRVYEVLAKKFGWTRVGIYNMLLRQNLHYGKRTGINLSN